MTNRLVAILLCVAFASGCGLLKRPDNHFYSLQTMPVEGAVRPASGTPFGIDGIELPPGLDRRGMVVRGANAAIEVRGTHQWTASLEEMVTHTLAFDLANRLPDGMVILPGQARPAAMRSVYVTFAELAAGPDQKFVLDARWSLAPGGPELARHERIVIDMPSMASAEIAKAMSSALAQLADRMAAGL